ncbi:FRG domain-containing protein [Chitinophagaceae bacterium LB-8]|uniref:FRG domain-containing protein n=1 Tax=Paraflavisolibacter caeni TaxID=2982496 RepID=A0A9X2XSX2_9BACT|nr:FRG domain-containing protein [Paraflavisolibacter caeni]MCU7548351.1 FRG domain-containing protein [Paraflavisolibacter caeni]
MNFQKTGHFVDRLMQHQGAPTRLLDFTKSPFIAAYFAFEHCTSRRDYNIAIWAINFSYLRQRSLEVLSQQFAEELKLSNNLINEEVFEKIFYLNKLYLVFPVEPFRLNRRYSLQQSIFVSTGTSEVPFMRQLSFLEDAMEPGSYKNRNACKNAKGSFEKSAADEYQ